MKGVSVILCCYNSAKRLPQTLHHLANQVFEEKINWEVVLVNNNSNDETVATALELWESYGTVTPLHIVDESKPGLSFARYAGMKTANFNVFLFCDDDNWLANNYVNLVFKYFNKEPNLGAVGGWCEAIFEDKEPQWFNKFTGNFAVGKPISSTGYLNKANDYLYGAGMALSKAAINELDRRGFRNILSDRKGKHLSSGGDVELIYALRLIGYKIYFSEDLKFKHFMPSNRMSWNYLKQIRKSMYWSNFVLSIYVDAIKQQPFDGVAIIKKIIYESGRVIKLKNRIKTQNKYDTLFTLNQIEVRKMFLKKIWFYIATRKRLNSLLDA